MDFKAKLKFIWFLSLCAFAAARTIRKVEVEPLSETPAIPTDVSLNTPAAPAPQAAAKVLENFIAPPSVAVDFGDGNKLNEIEGKVDDSSIPLSQTSQVKTLESAQTGDIAFEGNLNHLQDDKIPTTNCESEKIAILGNNLDVVERKSLLEVTQTPILPKEGVEKEITIPIAENTIQPKILNTEDTRIEKVEDKKESKDAEQIVSAKNLESFSSVSTVSPPLNEIAKESASQIAEVEPASHTRKVDVNDEEKVPEKLKIFIESPQKPAAPATAEVTPAENVRENLREATTLGASVTLPSLQLTTPGIGVGISPSASAATQQAVSVASYPAATTTTQAIGGTINTVPAATTVYVPNQASQVQYQTVQPAATVTTAPIATTTIRPANYPVWTPNYSVVQQPSASLYPNLLNPFNVSLGANNAMQGGFGFGILASPVGWRTNFSNYLTFNRNTERRSPETINSKDDRVNSVAETEHATTIRGHPQVLHLFFPVKYLFPKPAAAETLADKPDGGVAKERKLSEDDVSLDIINSNTAEKTSLIFKLELPKPVVQFVSGVLDTFKPFASN